MNKTLLLILIFISNLSYSQCEGRYQSEIFNSVSLTTVNYSDVYNDDRHKMDIYTPEGDTAKNRPVIIFIHGGGFVAGDKDSTYCTDFCSSFAKRGYVTVSMNYRLTNFFSFLSKENQYEAIIKAMYDAKSAIRYLRKDFENGDSFGIDTSTIFIGGYSAGAITSLHLSYLNNINDLPSYVIDNDGSVFNPQSIASSVGGVNGFEGDAGNLGYSSKVSGVISFAGALLQTTWIDENDVPLVTAHGTLDSTVNYYCGAAFGQPIVVNMCGPGEMHPQANQVGVINDELIFNGIDHDWTHGGLLSSEFQQAVSFTSDFLFPLLPCNNTSLSYFDNNLFVPDSNRKLLKVVDLRGQEIEPQPNVMFLEIFDNGTVEKKIILE